MVVLLLLFVSVLILQAIFHPWGRSLTGAPTLSGRWAGEGTMPSGQKIGVYLTMHALLWLEGEDCRENCDLDGIMKVCTAEGLREYTFEGDVQEHHGRWFVMALRKKEDRPYGYELRKLHGQWPGGDTMRIAGVLEMDRSNTSTTEEGIWIDTRGERHRLTDAEKLDLTRPTFFSMRRGSENDFSKYCAGFR